MDWAEREGRGERDAILTSTTEGKAMTSDERQRRIDEARASYPRINFASIPGDDVLIDKPLDAARRLLAYARTTRDTNTREWLDGLAAEINQCAASIGEPIRVQHVRGEIRELRIVG